MKKLTRSEIKALARKVYRAIREINESKKDSIRKKYKLTKSEKKSIEKEIQKIKNKFNKNYYIELSESNWRSDETNKNMDKELSNICDAPREEEIIDDITLAQVEGNNLTTIERLIVSKYTS